MTRALRLSWVGALAAVIVGSVLPAQTAAMQLVDSAGINDKVEHFTAYAVLAALPGLDRFRCRRLELLSPGRSCDWHDFVANSCGIFAGVALVKVTRLAFRPHGSAAPPANSLPPSPGSSQHPLN